MSQQEFARLKTQAVRGATHPDPTTGAILPPLYQSTTFVQPKVGKDLGFTYSRSGNPTISALEARLGALEDSLPAVTFRTGMAALTGLFMGFLRAGDHIVVGHVVYGGTVRVLQEILGPFGVKSHFVDLTDSQAFAKALAQRPRLVLCESPANPTLKLTDIRAVAEAAHSVGAKFAVDNTLLTPALQRPLELGADFVIYSTTKGIEGHNATVGGAILTRSSEDDARLRFVRNALGIPQAPFEAWLTLQGIKTLPLRMKTHSDHALQVAEWLLDQEEVASVHYSYLDSNPQRELARRQQSGGGGLIAFELHGGAAAGIHLMNTVRFCLLAENLGATETLITHPASMTHASMPKALRERAGISDGLVRLSVGLEDPKDIIGDLRSALDSLVVEFPRSSDAERSAS